MIKNYFKVAFRNLIRNKGFTAINISGLAVGMASAILIILWMQDEFSYDQFHEKKDRIYQAWNRSVFDGKLQCWNTTPKILGPALRNGYPEVEEVARVNWPNSFLLEAGEKKIKATGNIVDSGFLRIFTFPLIKGNPSEVLNEPNSIVLTEKLARRLFGPEDPLGKIIKVENSDPFKVTGLLKDLPSNSKFDFEYLMPWAYLRKKGWDDESWGNNSTQNFVLLKKGASINAFDAKIKNITKEHTNGEENIEVFMHPASKWRLYSKFENGVNTGGRIEMVRLFGIIAGFILLIACINFMNLSTARSEKRAREVGIRKVAGARKSTIVLQFLLESVIIAFLAGLIALLLVQLSIPAFNRLTEKQVSISFGDVKFWAGGLAFVVFTGLLAGSYPAFFLSSFLPVSVLKGTFRKAHALVTPRKVLVVLQFTFAIVLIICTIIIQQQIRHAQDRDTGYSRDNLVYHYMTGDIEKNYTLIKNELLASGAVVSVTKTSSPLTEGWSDSWGFEWQGKDPSAKIDFDRYSADEGLVTTAGFALLKGRDMNLREYPTDSFAILLNESAVKIMGFKDPIGQIIKDDGTEFHVIGVIRDFILRSPFHPTKPMIIEGAKGWFNIIHMKMSTRGSMAANLGILERIFKKYNPEYPVEYHFIDEEYEQKFNDQKRLARLSRLFAGLTIFISCLGLLGLAAYMAENRVKEIGIRKVLGASIVGVTALLSRDFLKLVLLSLLLASPLAWWMMHTWLQAFPYRVNIQWWVFALAGSLSLLISLFTVSFQAVRAGMANPVVSLRTE